MRDVFDLTHLQSSQVKLWVHFESCDQVLMSWYCYISSSNNPKRATAKSKFVLLMLAGLAANTARNASMLPKAELLP